MKLTAWRPSTEPGDGETEKAVIRGAGWGDGMSYGDILYTVNEGIAGITINRPEKHNEVSERDGGAVKRVAMAAIGSHPSPSNASRRRDRSAPEDIVRMSVGNWVRLARVYSLMFDRLRKRVRQQCGCTLPQFDILAQLVRSGKPMSFRALSRQLLVTSGNLTAIVDRLERFGYVKRKRDTEDRRIVWVQLTRRGRRLMEEMIPRHAAHVRELMAVLNRSEELNLRRTLGILRDSLRLESG